MDNVLLLHRELAGKTYKHGSYKAFKINDPKPRDIHKASVHDRLVHHALYRILCPCFDRKFIHDSYSCRLGKGTHRAMNRFRDFGRKVSKNNTHTCWVLKCDIKKFFASINHGVLKNILASHIDDIEVLWLVGNIIDSFHEKNKCGSGLPLGNLTSQLLVNIYMNEFDQFVKRRLKVKYYIRYADDFVILHEDKSYLEKIIFELSDYLEAYLKLSLHPKKLSIGTFVSGIDFLGWIHFPHHRALRTSTKRRMMRNVHKNQKMETIQSYLGLLRHGNAYKIGRNLPVFNDFFS